MVSSPPAACRKRRRSSPESPRADLRDELSHPPRHKRSVSDNSDAHSASDVASVRPAVLCATQQKTPCGVGLRRRNEDRASPPFQDTVDQSNSEASSTGSSCCSSLPGYDSSHAEPNMLFDIGGRTESESWSCCGTSGGVVDISGFFHDEAVSDDACSESFSFDPEAVFVNDMEFADGSPVEESLFIGSSAENGSWFLNDLDSKGNDFLNEVLDQEWMAAAVANLEKLNETITSDSCVLHLLEFDHAGKVF